MNSAKFKILGQKDFFKFQMIQVNVRKDLTNNLYMQIGHEIFFHLTKSTACLLWAAVSVQGTKNKKSSHL